QYARLWSFAIVLAIVLLSMERLLTRLWAHPDDAAARALVIMGTAVLGICAAAAVVLIGIPLTRLAAAIDRQGLLPWPSSRGGRFVLWWATPLAIGCGYLLWRYSAEFGAVATA